ncbi:MAG: flagellar motor switch protein FliM [Pirellulales bacterium]|nr:flagellar motor switch protein FliM [Pirellulales bacterium]
MADLLSQNEVESLLSAMETQAPAKTSTLLPESPAHPVPRVREKVTPYDFKRPERVGKEQMRSLQSLHEGFGRNFGASLSGMLRSIVEMKLTSVDQLTYSEFVFSLENPTCFNVLRADPLEGNLILDINPAILYPIIDRMLGGGKDSGPISRRPLTEIELRLVGRITTLFLEELKHAWENVLELNLSLDRVESNPQLVQIVPPNEVVILICFELTLQDVRGMLSLCIPFNSIERIGNKLTANNWTYGRKSSTPETVEALSRHLRGALVEMEVQLAETKITTGELIGLRVGDIITTNKDQREALAVLVSGVPKFSAKAGVFKGNKAIQIEQVLVREPAPPSTPAPAASPTAAPPPTAKKK